MNTLQIKVQNKVASYIVRCGAIVCGNNDYQIQFLFDAEWNEHEAKTARFEWNDTYHDVEFKGNICPVPVISNTELCKVGVYVGDGPDDDAILSSTRTQIPCQRSIRCGAPLPSPDTGEHYTNEARGYAAEAKASAVRAEEAAAKAEGGVAGENGATFTPSVSDDGVLSWTNDKGLDNPSPANIKGAQGEPFTYEDFTPEQLEALKGEKGKDGVSVTAVFIEDGILLIEFSDGNRVTVGEVVGANGKDGVSATHSWNGTTLTVTSASGTSSADLKGGQGIQGEQGDPGYTPYIVDGYWYINGMSTEVKAEGSIPEIINGYWYINGVRTEVKAEGVDGKDGASVDRFEINEAGELLVFISNGKSTNLGKIVGADGTSGTNGKDGVSATHSWNGTTLTVTSASGTSSANLKGADGKTAYQYAQDGGYTGTEAEFSEMLAGGDSVPDYWEDHLSKKIKTIKALQDNGGKDAFSFIVITDIHHPANLGKRSPTIAKRILDECDIKYAMCLGDTQTRACHSTKEQILSENEKIEKMLNPIRDRLLQTQGNHDGNYGILNSVTYVYSLTKGEMHSAIYRKVGLVGECHFDESGTGYYIDDTANKVRYIVLNTHNTSYETNADGTQKYSPMSVWRYTQSQFDLLIDALETVPSDMWNVVVSAHVPLTRTEIGDRTAMMGVLKAYKNKSSYAGEYLGTASSSATYTNQLQIATDGSGNIYNSVGFKNKSRLNSSGVIKDYTDGAAFVTGFIPVKAGDIIRLNGNYIKADATGVGALNWWFYTNFSSTISACTMDYITSAYFTNVKTNSEGYVTEFSISPTSTFQTAAYMRLTLLGEGENCIITVNEEIVDSAHGYDYVSVDVDFSNAKGNLVGYFAGHSHTDSYAVTGDIPVITTRCDGMEENTADLKAERIAGTITEQSFDVFTVNKATRTIHATKIGAGADRTITY